MKSLRIMLSVLMVFAFASVAMATVTIINANNQQVYQDSNSTLGSITQETSGFFTIRLTSTGGSSPVCGNGTVETGEQCDPPGAACSATCQNIGGTSPVCGNGILETGEQCDPPGANCSATCQTITPPPGTGCTLLPFMGGRTSVDFVTIAGHTNDSTGYINYCFDVPANSDTVAFAINSGDWGTDQDLIMSNQAQPTWENWRNTVSRDVAAAGYALSRVAKNPYWYKWTPNNNESLIVYGLKSASVKRYYVTIFNPGAPTGKFKYGWNAY